MGRRADAWQQPGLLSVGTATARHRPVDRCPHRRSKGLQPGFHSPHAVVACPGYCNVRQPQAPIVSLVQVLHAVHSWPWRPCNGCGGSSDGRGYLLRCTRQMHCRAGIQAA